VVYLSKLEFLNFNKQISILLVLSLLSFTSGAQSYFANGSARAIGSSCYQLTSATNWQLGSVWYADKIDLSKDFDLEFELNFGSSDAGADGIVFVMQTVGNRAIGLSGGGIGFEGFSPSLGIEFDTWDNDNMSDLATDHIAILRNGSVDHGSSNAIAAPVSALVSGANIEDNTNHLVRVTWVAATNLLEVWFDCDKRQSTTIDIQNSIFGGQNEVFWGFTSSTGGANNRQTACLRDDILVQDTFAICRGETTLLNAKESYDGTYTWTPTNFLDDPTIRTPECSSTIPYTYYVEYKDRCNNTFLDTVEIKIDEPFTMDSSDDSLLCDAKGYAFDLRSEYDSVLWNNGLRNARVTWFNAGEYKLRVWKGVCYDDDTFTIRTDVSPTIAITGDSIFCENDSTEINLDVAPASATFIWQNASTSNSQIFDSTTLIAVTATNECNTVEETYSVREIFLPDLDLGPDSTICEGDTVFLQGPLQNNLNHEWNTGEASSTKTITEEGTYSVIISEAELCYDYDTISFDGIPFPRIGLVDDVLLCKNEEIELNVSNEFGEVLWDNSIASESFVIKNREGVLTIQSVNQCGSDSTSLNIDLIDCFCSVWLPNAITVNGDNLNETLKPTIDCPKLRSYGLKVYNRWGEKLWESSDINENWDATFKEKNVQSGVYFWIANWSGIENGQLERFADKGVLHVIR